MKEGEAATVGLEPPAQVGPSVDLMNGFVFDETLEDERRRAPVDALQVEESAVEPRAEQVQQIFVERSGYFVINLQEQAWALRDNVQGFTMLPWSELRWKETTLA